MSHSHTIKEYPGQLVGIAALSAVAGAITAMMLTPKRGHELRKDIKLQATKVKDTARARMQPAKQEAKKSTARATKTTRSASSRTRSTATKIKADAKSAAKTTKATARRTSRVSEAEAERIRRHGEP